MRKKFNATIAGLLASGLVGKIFISVMTPFIGDVADIIGLIIGIVILFYTYNYFMKKSGKSWIA